MGSRHDIKGRNLALHLAGDEVPSHCCQHEHVRAGLSWQDQAVHVLGYEAGVQLSSLKGRVLAQALQELYICRQPTYLQENMPVVILTDQLCLS